MEKVNLKKDILYKTILNDKNEDDFLNQVISNKLYLRKNKLYKLLMQKRNQNISSIEKENTKEILLQIAILIHKEDFENISSGLNMFYDYLINNKLGKENIKYIFENIYYRLLDIIISEKSFDKNKNMNYILFLINYLTTENNVFIGPITEDLFLTNLKKIIEININNKLFINEIIPLLSDMLSNRQRFAQIMNEIEVINIIKIKITENNKDKDDIEKLFILINNFILNISEDKIHRFKFILEYILNFLNSNDIINNIKKLNNDENTSIMISLFDILIYMAKNKKNVKILYESNCISFIKNLIINNNFNSNIYLIKSYELLSNILMNSESAEYKKNILTFIYNNISDLPFSNELYESIKNENKSFIYILLNCIVSLVNSCSEFCELYCFNDNFLNFLIKLFSDKKTWKKIKNEIIIFFINIIENNNNTKIFKYLLNTQLFSIIISYISTKIKAKTESTKIIIYNILLLINHCLKIDDKNETKIMVFLLEKYKFKDTLETLIEIKNDSISDISRKIFIKYFSAPENIYCQNNNINNKKNDNDMIIE